MWLRFEDLGYLGLRSRNSDMPDEVSAFVSATGYSTAKPPPKGFGLSAGLSLSRPQFHLVVATLSATGKN